MIALFAQKKTTEDSGAACGKAAPRLTAPLPPDMTLRAGGSKSTHPDA
ncbi:MAG: hypothetical protein J1D88_00525 [Treponema sp.]|nr:hypothetical protein [Treponema sp.]